MQISEINVSLSKYYKNYKIAKALIFYEIFDDKKF